MIKYLLQVKIYITGRRSIYIHHDSGDVWNLARVNGITSKIKNGAKRLENLLSH